MVRTLNLGQNFCTLRTLKEMCKIQSTNLVGKGAHFLLVVKSSHPFALKIKIMRFYVNFVSLYSRDNYRLALFIYLSVFYQLLTFLSH